MSFTCDCSYDGYEEPELYDERFPIAKKKHMCCECGGNIKPGQKYHRATGKWDGDFRSFKTCLPCNSIREHYCPHGYVLGGLAEQISNCLEFDYRKIITKEVE